MTNPAPHRSRMRIAADRPGRAPRLLALPAAAAILALAVQAPTAGAQDPSTAGSPGATSTTFTSTLYPYTITLPPGWSGIPAESGSDRDLFVSDTATGHANSAGTAPADQTLAERVDLRRSEAIAEGCSSDPAEDQPATLGGEPAILWIKHCPSYVGAVLSTIHHGHGYGLTVEVPLDSTLAPTAMLNELAATFRFTDEGSGGEASPTPPDLDAVAAQLLGSWRTEWAPQELWIASVEAAGLDPEVGGWAADARTATQERVTIRFQDGQLQQFEAYDGGPDQLGWTGTYEVVGPHTIEATEVGTFDKVTYDFVLRGNVLTMDVVGDSEPADLVPQTGLYETLPFTRLP